MWFESGPDVLGFFIIPSHSPPEFRYDGTNLRRYVRPRLTPGAAGGLMGTRETCFAGSLVLPGCVSWHPCAPHWNGPIPRAHSGAWLAFGRTSWKCRRLTFPQT